MTNNEKIFRNGTVKKAKKLKVLTFSLGTVGELKPLKGVIDRMENGTVRLHTKEAPAEGTAYPVDHVAVVRVLGGRVFIDGKYDIYTLSAEKAAQKLVHSISKEKLVTDKQLKELQPLLDCGKECRGFITPEEIRKVIVITEDMGVDTCYNEWEPETPCPMVPGDVFLVSDEATCTGYRIGKEEFEETHILL